MKFHSNKFFFLKDGTVRGRQFRFDFLNDYPRFDKYGERITNPFTYVLLELLEKRVLGELSAQGLAPGIKVQIHISVAEDEHDYWVEAEVDTDVD